MSRSVLAFMLVVQPRKVVFNPNSLRYGWQSVEALIIAAERVQEEAGPPIPGTYRHAFMNDTTPRKLPISHRIRCWRVWTDDAEALQVLAG